MKNKKNNQKKSKKSLILKIAVVFLILVIVYVGWVMYQFETKQLFLINGEVYNRQELQEKYPHHYHVEAKNTPKEVYSKFRQALLNDNIEKALECIEKEKREKYRKILENKEKKEKWSKKLPREIKLENKYENHAYYNIDMGTKNKNTISFIKNQEGYWKIKLI